MNKLVWAALGGAAVYFYCRRRMAPAPAADQVDDVGQGDGESSTLWGSDANVGAWVVDATKSAWDKLNATELPSLGGGGCGCGG